jgi:dihydrofolate synthase/folylpolyglutamate synthase
MSQVLPLSLGGRRPGRIRPELGPLRAALSKLGDPHLAYPSILVVGTNGKGSTSAVLDAVLGAHGLRTGLTTSPHLVSVEERIRIAGRDVDTGELERQIERLAAFRDLTYFETITCAAFLAFAEAGVELAVLEAGMGGSWDATRVADSIVAGLTNVGSDHPSWLGASAIDRARDKGGALRGARRAVLGSGVAAGLVPALAAPHAVEARSLVEVEEVGDERVRLAWPGHAIEATPPLAGRHQCANLELALALARAAEFAGIAPPLDADAVVRGLGEVRWPGRLDERRIGGRTILVDGAHNPEGAAALAAHLERRGERRNLLFSCLADKAVEDMAGRLAPVVGEVVVVELDDERAMPIDRLAGAFPGARRAPDLESALDLLPDPVLATGSLRLVGRLVGLAGRSDER